MKKLTRLHGTAKVFALSLLLSVLQQITSAQQAPVPIPGTIYNQAIVACKTFKGMAYLATGTSIYARPDSAGAHYTKVYTAPVGYAIADFDNIHYYNGDFRYVLLSDANGNSYVGLNQIISFGPDIPSQSLVSLPQSNLITFETVPYVKIACTDGAVYALWKFNVCGTEGALYVSHDDGQTWAQDTAGIGVENVYDFAIDTAQNLYILGPGYLYSASSDSVIYFTDPHSGYSGFVGNSTFIYVDKQNRIVLSGWDSVYVSSDGGATFTGSLPGEGVVSSFFGESAGGNLLCMAYDSLFNNRIFSYSADSASWTDIDSNFSITNSANISCFGGANMLYVGTGSGLFTSADNGVNWSASEGILAEDILSFITLPSGSSLCSTEQDVFIKNPSDTAWNLIYQAPVNYKGLLLYNDEAGNIFITAQPSQSNLAHPSLLMQYNNNGGFWENDSAGLSGITGTCFYVDETGGKHFYGNQVFSVGGPLLFSESSSGSQFAVDTSGFSTNGVEAYNISSLCSDKSGYLYADLFSGGQSSMMRRLINGTQWVKDDTGLNGINVTSMASSHKYGIIAAAKPIDGDRPSTLFRRAVNGWVQVPLNSSNVYITSVSIDENGVIYVAETNLDSPKESGVYYTSDNGATWSHVYLEGMNLQGTTAQVNFEFAVGGLVSIGDSTYALTKGNWGYVFTSVTTPAGITVTTQGSSVVAFPNPSSTGVWNLKSEVDFTGSPVELMDLDGRTIYHSIITSPNPQISVPGLASGAYILMVAKGDKSFSSILIKQ